MRVQKELLLALIWGLWMKFFWTSFWSQKEVIWTSFWSSNEVPEHHSVTTRYLVKHQNIWLGYINNLRELEVRMNLVYLVFLDIHWMILRRRKDLAGGDVRRSALKWNLRVCLNMVSLDNTLTLCTRYSRYSMLYLDLQRNTDISWKRLDPKIEPVSSLHFSVADVIC